MSLAASISAFEESVSYPDCVKIQLNSVRATFAHETAWRDVMHVQAGFLAKLQKSKMHATFDSEGMHVYVGKCPSRPPTRDRLRDIENTLVSGSVLASAVPGGVWSADWNWREMIPEKGLTPKLLAERQRSVCNRKGLVVTSEKDA